MGVRVRVGRVGVDRGEGFGRRSGRANGVTRIGKGRCPLDDPRVVYTTSSSYRRLMWYTCSIRC